MAYTVKPQLPCPLLTNSLHCVNLSHIPKLLGKQYQIQQTYFYYPTQAVCGRNRGLYIAGHIFFVCDGTTS